MISTWARMQFEEAKRDLDDLSIDNLYCGRITKEVMQYAIDKTTGDGKREIVDWRLADFLNDLLKVAAEKSPHKIPEPKHRKLLDDVDKFLSRIKPLLKSYRRLDGKNLDYLRQQVVTLTLDAIGMPEEFRGD